MKTKIILLLFSFLWLFSCTKGRSIKFKEKEDKVPTEINHFYFYINKNGTRELMVAKKPFSFNTFPPSKIHVGETGLYRQFTSIDAYREDKFNYTISLYKNITHAGIYQMMHYDMLETGNSTSVHSKAHIYYNSKMYISEDNCGMVDITYLSPSKEEMKATFNMTLYNSQNPQDSLVIEDGHFWINVNTLD